MHSVKAKINNSEKKIGGLKISVNLHGEELMTW
jgi:hypothetical protein